MRASRLIAAVACATAVFSSAGGDGPPPVPRLDPSGPVVIRYDDVVTQAEPGPHGGGGETTASRYFDDVPDAGLVFRRRALHAGSAIGVHQLRHDEVYYVLAGRGELTVNDLNVEVAAGAAIFLREGANVGLRQLGNTDLVIIVAYPPFE